MILLDIKRDNENPIYRQIIDQVSGFIENDTLKKGSILPSSREMANKLGIDRTTVYRAYQELQALGYVESAPGSYTVVRDRPKLVTPARRKDNGKIKWNEKSSQTASQLFETFLQYTPEQSKNMPKDMINLSPLNLDQRLFPVNDFRRCINQEMAYHGAELLQYGNIYGYPPLREYIAYRMQVHGISVDASEILITNGAQHALDLVLNLFCETGTRAAIESPTYANIIPLLNYHNIEILGIPMKNDGLDLDYLESKIVQQNPAFLYTIPNFHNPTGITTTQKHRENLLNICEWHGIPIIEDGFEEEMKYFGKVGLPIKSMDRNQIVIYLGTFSKVLFPGVRLGWIAADRECIKRLTAIKRFTDLSSGSLIQAAVESFCRQGYYNLHVKRLHRIFRNRMRIALDSLQKEMPDHVNWTKPDGGYTIWLKFENSYLSEDSFKNHLAGFGVMASPGEYYFHGSKPHQFCRLSISSLAENEITEGITRLGKALKKLN